MISNMCRFPMALTVAMFSAGCAPEAELLRIEGLHQTIVIYPGLNEPTYSLETPGGKVLIPAMTLMELQASHPDLYRRVNAMRAGTVWAGM